MEASQINIISQTINSIFQNLFNSIDNNIYNILDDITFINTDILNDSYFEKIFGNSTSSGLLLISNSLLIGYLLYYCINLIIANFTLSPIQNPLQFLFRIIIVGIFMNCSYFICNEIISFNSFFSLAIRELGENIFSKNICFSELIIQLNSTIYTSQDNFNLFSIDGIIKTIFSVGFFNLIFSYSLRYIMIKIFVLISPFAILSLSINTTNFFFKSWLKSFLSLLFIQILISIILLVIFSINFNSNIFSKFLYVGSIYSLIKANSYIKELFGGISTDVNINIANLKNNLKGV